MQKHGLEPILRIDAFIFVDLLQNLAGDPVNEEGQENEGVHRAVESKAIAYEAQQGIIAQQKRICPEAKADE